MDPSRKRRIRFVVALSAAVLLAVDAGLALGFGPARLSRKPPAGVPFVVDAPPRAGAPGPAPA